MITPTGLNAHQTSNISELKRESNNASGGKKKALIISISSYKHLRLLDFCQKNGEAMHSLLQVLGYEISDNHKLIGEVKWETIRNAIMKFFKDKSAKSKDTLLLYFSGHVVPDAYGDTYLATSEIDPDSPWDKGFFEELTTIMNRSLSSRIVLILDCCCSGAATINKGDENEAAKLAIASMDKKSNILKEYKLEEGEGKCLLAAFLATQAAFGLRKKDYSVFTYHLLEGLRGANGDSVDNEGRVTPESLGAYVYEKVTQSSPKKTTN